MLFFVWIAGLAAAFDQKTLKEEGFVADYYWLRKNKHCKFASILVLYFDIAFLEVKRLNKRFLTCDGTVQI